MKWVRVAAASERAQMTRSARQMHLGVFGLGTGNAADCDRASQHLGRAAAS
jgi:hypothetical protein